ncbi:MAG: hypothetical protein KAW01_01325 [Deltaproteobacteria bacterium]|nr:hypothetical protein [Deltaproteobacteria bacterium]
MDYNKALVALNSIRERYNTIPTPKYANANLATLQDDFNQLKNMKELLRDNADYHRLISSVGKVLSRMQPADSEWKNIAERSVNKAIRPTSQYNSKPYGFTEWENKYGQQQAIIPQRNWSARHFMALDIIGYSYMLQRSEDDLLKNDLPLFNNPHDIELKNDDLSVTVSDKQFRQYSSLAMKSKDISRLLQEVASSTFKLNYPVRLLFHNNGKKGEHIHSMTDFSSFFSIGSISGNNNKTYEIRFDTLLGQLFLHNLRVRNCDYIPAITYHLPHPAQILYRRFILNNNYPQVSVNLANIIQALGYTYSNKTDLINTITAKAIEPLIKSKILASYTFTDGLSDKKFILRKVSKGGGSS